MPTHQLPPIIGPALSALSPDDLRHRIGARAAQMTVPQRGSLMQTMLAGLEPNVLSVRANLGLDPSLAQHPSQASGADAGTLAAHVQQERPELFNQAMAVYAQHPVLVKMLGAAAIAQIAQQLTQREGDCVESSIGFIA